MIYNNCWIARLEGLRGKVQSSNPSPNTHTETNKKGKREYLKEIHTSNFVRSLNEYFDSKVEIPRIRMGKAQEIETLINEEALLFAMFLRNQKQTWNPRILQTL